MAKIPTLQELTSERPSCQLYRKPLKPYTPWFYMPGHFGQPQTLAEIQAVKNDIATVDSRLVYYEARLTAILPIASSFQHVYIHSQDAAGRPRCLTGGGLGRVW